MVRHHQGHRTRGPPFLDRSLLLPRSPPSVRFPHVEFKRYATGIHTSADMPPVSTAILELTAVQILALKRSCAATTPSPRRITTYEAVAAHVWRQACMARRRLRPPLPEGYIGNVIFPSVAIAAVGDVASEPPGDVASRIHRDRGRRVPALRAGLLGDGGGREEPRAVGGQLHLGGSFDHMLDVAAELRGRLRVGEAGVHGTGIHVLRWPVLRHAQATGQGVGRFGGRLDGGGVHGLLQGAIYSTTSTPISASFSMVLSLQCVDSVMCKIALRFACTLKTVAI
ncbi:hypothetical protein OPV22_027433 [Ensete ventricosum]|uniref:Uncharacterized protein n=1 Tax=Ensete ventricosum TaxID=4639 RepID=A0AAV8P468_ENSVE|nr:hypothetical protein OPV22_027433 [Ensete ventricosum]RWW03372.1 hypothetical protein GW17_00033472 [Ensete ventricosum]RWW53300.1 hypothetical protein BHE74_00040224 [Ensete ventricosum]RZS15745.1 hypothetical protein BHM03_00047619 [Ensete ventricosum]